MTRVRSRGTFRAVRGPFDIRLAARYGPLGLCMAVLVWHALQYGFVTDDAYISFVYARNFAEHGELVFNLGDPVEGYTNFLWTFVLGVLLVVGLQPEVTALALGIAFACATLVVVARTIEYLQGDHDSSGDATGAPDWPWSSVAPALLCFSAGYACWASGGLETQMFTFLCALALYCYARGGHPEVPDGRWLRRAGIALALAAMTRPEGLLLTALVGVHRLVSNLVRERRLLPVRQEWLFLAWFLALWAPWYAWRFWYYGYPFPNTYYVKAAGEPPPGYAAALTKGGLYYVWQWAIQTKAVYLSPLIAAGLLWARPGSRRLYYGSLAGLFAVVYLGYTVRVGGDFMGLHRFIMPVFVICAIGAALGLALVVRTAVRWLPGLSPGRRPAVLALALSLPLVVGHASDQISLTRTSMKWGNWAADHGIDTPAFLRIYTLDRAAIGEHMRDCFQDGDFSIVGGAGAQPYKARMRAIDVFGLVSERVAHEVPPTKARAGHNKWAPNKLLLAHEPDFVFSCYSIHRQPKRPHFNCSPGFWRRNGYERVTLHIPTLRQDGQYYSFFKRKDRAFTCPGQVQ